MPSLPILPSKPHQPHEELVLVGFRVDPQHDGPEFYTLLAVGGDNERPLINEGRIVFFSRPQLADKALAMDASMKSSGRRRKRSRPSATSPKRCFA